MCTSTSCQGATLQQPESGTIGTLVFGGVEGSPMIGRCGRSETEGLRGVDVKRTPYWKESSTTGGQSEDHSVIRQGWDETWGPCTSQRGSQHGPRTQDNCKATSRAVDRSEW